MKERSLKTTSNSYLRRPARITSRLGLKIFGGVFALGLVLSVFLAPPIFALDASETQITNFQHASGASEALFEVRVKEGLTFYRAEYYASETVLEACPEAAAEYHPNQGYTRDLEGLDRFYKEEAGWRIWGYKTDDDLKTTQRSICFAIVAENNNDYVFHGPYQLGQSSGATPSTTEQASQNNGSDIAEDVRQTTSAKFNTVVYDLDYLFNSKEVRAFFNVRTTDSAAERGLYVSKVRFHNHEEVQECTGDVRNHYDREVLKKFFWGV